MGGGGNGRTTSLSAFILYLTAPGHRERLPAVHRTVLGRPGEKQPPGPSHANLQEVPALAGCSTTRGTRFQEEHIFTGTLRDPSPRPRAPHGTGPSRSPMFTWLELKTVHLQGTAAGSVQRGSEQPGWRTSPCFNYLENDFNRRAVPPHSTHRLGLLEWEPSFPRLSPLLCSAGEPGWNVLQIDNRGGPAASGFCQAPQGRSGPGSLPMSAAGPPGAT